MKVARTSIPMRHRHLIYILAASYTGSILPRLLLAKHKGIATIGGPKAAARGNLDTGPFSCGALQWERAFWKSVMGELQKIETSCTMNDIGTHSRSDSPLSQRVLRAGVRVCRCGCPKSGLGYTDWRLPVS
jgi:hypothetical protein